MKTKVTGSEVLDNGAGRVKLTMEPSKGGDSKEEEFDVVLVSTGRRPFTEGMGLEEMGIEMDKMGRVVVDDHFRSNIPSIFAIGDVIDGPMLAHKAEEEGIAAVEFIKGLGGHVNYDAIPGVIYTFPEVATVGKTEEQLKEEGKVVHFFGLLYELDLQLTYLGGFPLFFFYSVLFSQTGTPYNKGTFPMQANSRARTVRQADGIVKILSHKETDQVLGVHIVGSNAGEMIMEGVIAIEYGASSEDIARTCHAHPTLSEAFKEAAMATYDKPIHF